MAENENLVETGKSSASFGAKVKEWFRKLIVKLKRKTQTIPLVVILITSLVYLCTLATYAQVIEVNSGIPNLGIAMFVNTLMSILILPIFLNAFPKRKKPNKIFIVLIFLVLALLVGMDMMFYMNTKNFFAELGTEADAMVLKAYTQLIIHIVFVGVSIVVFALLPLYKKAINKINTRKNLEENNLSEQIDTSAEV